MQYCIKIEPTKQLVEYPSDIAKIKLGVAFFNTNNSTSSEILIATMDKKTVCSKTKINYNVTSLGNIIYPDTLTYNSNSKDPYHSTPLAYLAQQGTDSAFLKFTFETQVRYFTLRFMIDLFVIVNIISVYIFFFRVKTNLKK